MEPEHNRCDLCEESAVHPHCDCDDPSCIRFMPPQPVRIHTIETVGGTVGITVPSVSGGAGGAGKPMQSNIELNQLMAEAFYAEHCKVDFNSPKSIARAVIDFEAGSDGQSSYVYRWAVPNDSEQMASYNVKILRNEAMAAVEAMDWGDEPDSLLLGMGWLAWQRNKDKPEVLAAVQNWRKSVPDYSTSIQLAMKFLDQVPEWELRVQDEVVHCTINFKLPERWNRGVCSIHTHISVGLPRIICETALKAAGVI